MSPLRHPRPRPARRTLLAAFGLLVQLAASCVPDQSQTAAQQVIYVAGRGGWEPVVSIEVDSARYGRRFVSSKSGSAADVASHAFVRIGRICWNDPTIRYVELAGEDGLHFLPLMADPALAVAEIQCAHVGRGNLASLSRCICEGSTRADPVVQKKLVCTVYGHDDDPR
jgi:hypothetical protein